MHLVCIGLQAGLTSPLIGQSQDLVVGFVPASQRLQNRRCRLPERAQDLLFAIAAGDQASRLQGFQRALQVAAGLANSRTVQPEPRLQRGKAIEYCAPTIQTLES